MKKLLFLVLIALFSIGAFGQEDFSSSRLDTLSTRLKRDTVDLSERATDDLRRSPGAARALIEEAFLASQMDASVGLFQDMIRDRRRASELRDAAAILNDVARRAPSVSNNATLWRSVQTSINDISRELGGTTGGGGTVDNRPILGRVYWRGMVDDKIQLVIRGSQVETRTISGRTMPDGTFSFTSALPAGDVTVGVTRTRGRGPVKIIQQPSKSNEFTAIVEVYDDGGGSRDYQLDIYWK
ncbi:MAG: hypothetical protein IPN69_02625 [Acidobacteria bacterium]|nr:hypothetical protein [Acidobacteriota bacterium]